MLAAFATDPGPPSELIRLSEHRSHVSRHRAILACPEPETLRNALVAIRAVAAMIPEELRHALRHCRGAHGWSSRRLSAASSIPPNNHTLSHVATYHSLMASLALILHLIDGVDAGTGAFLVSQLLAHVDYLEEAISMVSEEVEGRLAPFTQHLMQLDTIPGIDQEVLVGLLGTENSGGLLPKI